MRAHRITIRPGARRRGHHAALLFPLVLGLGVPAAGSTPACTGDGPSLPDQRVPYVLEVTGPAGGQREAVGLFSDAAWFVRDEAQGLLMIDLVPRADGHHLARVSIDVRELGVAATFVADGDGMLLLPACAIDADPGRGELRSFDGRSIGVAAQHEADGSSTVIGVDIRESAYTCSIAVDHHSSEAAAVIERVTCDPDLPGLPGIRLRRA